MGKTSKTVSFLLEFSEPMNTFLTFPEVNIIDKHWVGLEVHRDFSHEMLTEKLEQTFGPTQ